MCWPIFWSASLNSSICLLRALVSEPLAALFSASSFVLTSVLRSSGILSALSLMIFSAWWIMWSAWLRTSTSSLFARSSDECSSASLTIRSTSSLARVEEAVMVTDCSRPVPLSWALTFKMPLASMSNVTSICGMPRGEGGIPSRWKRPRVRLSRAISRSPWSTWTSTDVWLSAAVENTCDREVGMVVLRSITLVATPPSVSTPSDSGVTSRRRMSLTSPLSTPAWMAAPTATTSSGLTPLWASLPPSRFLTSCWITGMRVDPPTSTTSSICCGVRLASLSAARNGPRQRSVRSAVGLEVDSVLLLELLGEPVHDPPVVVVATQVGVAVGGFDLEDSVADVEDGNVKGPATQVEDQDRLVGLLVEAIRERSRGGLVDDAEHVQARDLACVLGRLALRVVEVGGHGDDRVRDLLAKVCLGVGLQLLQDHGRDLFGREVLVHGRHMHDDAVVLARLNLVRNDLSLGLHLGELAAHEALDRVDGVLGVDGSLPARERADEPLTRLRECDHRWGGAGTFRVRDDDRLAAFHDGDDRVGRPQVDSYGFRHL